MVLHRRNTGLDILGVKGDGVYCVMPFSSLDSKNKAAFKIGIATKKNFYNRLERNYHTYFPMGFYYSNFLENPINLKAGRKNPTYSREIEKYIFNHIENAVKIKSDARINNDQQTEWVYCTSQDLKKVFNDAQEIYGGTVHNYPITEASIKQSEPKHAITTMTIKFS